MENLEMIIANNISSLRKSFKMTQLELAEKLNYTDKAVSKWERGEGVPDIYILKQIAEIFHTDVNFLITEHKPNFKAKTSKLSTRSKVIIPLLSFGFVWFIATCIFVILSLLNLNIDKLYLAFIYAIPVSFVTILIFNMIWGKRFYNVFLWTLILWTAFLSVYLTFELINLWLIFLIAIPIQIILILWQILKK